jgi:hypothetical protein
MMTNSKKYRCEQCGLQTEMEGVIPAVSECCKARWIEVEPLPACGMPASAEHSRFDGEEEPCDDGRSG